MDETEKRLLEIRLRSAELELERLQQSHGGAKARGSRWDSPLILAIAGAIGTALLAIVNNGWQYRSSKETERNKLESSLILKAIDSPTAADRKNALLFLVDAGLIIDNGNKIRNIPEDSVPRVRSTSVAVSSETKSKYLNLIPVPESINPNLTAAQRSTLLTVFGAPGALTQDPGEVTNDKLKRFIVTGDAGPFKIRGLKPAVEAIQRVMNRVKSEMPDLYIQLGYEGMLVVRLIRGSTSVFTNHAWGTAIDISISGEWDRIGDGRCAEGLALLAPLFNEEGFYWGAGATREESGHFEVSEELLQKWIAQGMFK